MEILKQLRDEANLTQETVADRLGVSVNTIQNWERTGKITKESLHDLLDLYNTDHLTRNRVVLSIFGDTRTLDQKSTIDNFPEFLFTDRPDITSAARRGVLSADEMELFGYTYYMDGFEDEYDYDPCKWPLEYLLFKDYGGYFATMKLLNSIEERIGNYIGNGSKNANKGIYRLVYNYGVNNPGKGFSFVALPKTEIIAEIKNLPHLDGAGTDISTLYEKCKAVEEPFLLGTSKNGCDRYNLPEIIYKIVDINDSYYWRYNTYELKLDEICGQCIEIDKREVSDNDYVMKKGQYLSDRKAYDEHPDLYDREPSFEYEFEYWLTLTKMGEQYIKWVEA